MIRCKWQCAVCGQEHEKDIQTGAQEVARSEVAVSNGRADVAILDEHGCVRTILEVIHTHATEHRDGEWYEFIASDCITVQENKLLEVTCTRQRPLGPLDAEG